MLRSLKWMFSLLAIAGLTSATAAKAQPSHTTNTSDKNVLRNLGQLNLDGTGGIDGKGQP
jgi:hypothetical protein